MYHKVPFIHSMVLALPSAATFPPESCFMAKKKIK